MNNKQIKLLKIQEVEDLEIANQLYLSGDYCQPRYSENKRCYIFIPRKR